MERRFGLGELRRNHPIFFWGSTVLVVLLLAATVATAIRIPIYRSEASQIGQHMDSQERATRDRILQAKRQRASLAVALIRREVHLKALQEKGVHLAISIGDSTLALREGPVTLRTIPIQIGRDTIVRAPDGRTWRFVRAAGERHVASKARDPDGPLPEWVYLQRGAPVPPADQRKEAGVMGDYVIRLDDGTRIYSRPGSGPLAEGVLPAGFVASEHDLAAIFAAIDEDTPVYIY